MTLVLLKLGGSLITDKSREQTLRQDVLDRLCQEIATARVRQPDLQVVIGHGSGSFGHIEAARYRTRAGVKSPADWLGYAHVAHVAAKLNRSVLDALRAAGVPALNCPPSASAVARDAVVQSLALEPIRKAVANGLVPLVMGDVALDEVRGGTIISTEDIFRYLAIHLQPSRILLAGIERGVLDRWPDGNPIPLISNDTIEAVRHVLRGSHAADVTGGMESKVLEMLAMARAQPGLEIRIFAGTEPGLLTDVLLAETSAGTLVQA